MPELVQSISVPICSSAFDVSEKPPIPTQNAEYVWLWRTHRAVGWRQAPTTRLKWTRLRWIA